MAVSLNYILPATGAVAPVAGQVVDCMIVDVTATADADAAAVIPHLMRAIPLEINVQKILSNALAAEPGWSVGVVDATNVNLVKLATVGSGNAAAQIRVTIRRPHTLGR